MARPVQNFLDSLIDLYSETKPVAPAAKITKKNENAYYAFAMRVASTVANAIFSLFSISNLKGWWKNDNILADANKFKQDVLPYMRWDFARDWVEPILNKHIQVTENRKAQFRNYSILGITAGLGALALWKGGTLLPALAKTAAVVAGLPAAGNLIWNSGEPTTLAPADLAKLHTLQNSWFYGSIFWIFSGVSDAPSTKVSGTSYGHTPYASSNSASIEASAPPAYNNNTYYYNNDSGDSRAEGEPMRQ